MTTIAAPVRLSTRDRIIDVLTRSRGTWFSTAQLGGRLGMQPSTVGRWLLTMHGDGSVEKRVPATRAAPGKYSAARMDNAITWRVPK